MIRLPRLSAMLANPGVRNAPGTEPGVMLVAPNARPTTIRVLAWKGDVLEEIEYSDVAELNVIAERNDVTWIDVEGLADLPLLQSIGDAFDIHPLVLEDITGVHSRAKIDRYGDACFVVARMSSIVNDEVQSEQLSIFVAKSVVITFQEGLEGDSFDPLRRRIRGGATDLRTSGADYLLYSLLDSVIDGYFPVLEALGEHVERLEETLLASPTNHLMGEIHSLKRVMLGARRSVWPMREVLTSLTRDDTGLIADDTRTYLFDTYDHCVQVIDLLETYRELASGLVDLYLSTMSNRMNEVMKVLTVIASIFIPLSFIAGFYGMNFTGSQWAMPELRWKYGYEFAIALMVIVFVVQIVFFRRKGWIGRSSSGDDR